MAHEPLRNLGALERYRPLVDDWPAFVDVMSRPAPGCVWTHGGRVSAEAMLALLAESGVEPTAIPWKHGAFRVGNPKGIGNHWWYRAGLCHSQEEASILPVGLLDPQPGERILDLCASPGGKTAQISLAVGPTGTVVANEYRISRLRGLRSTVDRLGLTNVSMTNHDGVQFPMESGPYDRVLVDAPCSDEGIVRRKPHLVTKLGERLSQEMSAKQKGLLRRALALCRPGGRVVYSTCTFAPEENEAVVDAALRRQEAPARIVEARMPGFETAEGIQSWGERRFDPSLRHTVRVWPHRHDTGGFYVAVLEREGEAAGEAAGEATFSGLEPAPEGEWKPLTGERYDLPPEVWEDLVVFRRSKPGLHVATCHHRAPVAPELHATGVLLVKDRVNHPKLSSVGALLLGRHARRNVVELTPNQLPVYLARGTSKLVEGQDDLFDGGGYVVVRFRGFPLGTGLHRRATGELESLFPRRWSTTG